MNAEGVTVTERDILIKLLELYKDFPCLWDLSHKDYANRDARNQAYLIMLNVFKKNDSAATLKTLKTKLDNMRTSYKRERKKVEASKTSGAGNDEVHLPSLWYYEHLSFLDEKTTPTTEEPATKRERVTRKKQNDILKKQSELLESAKILISGDGTSADAFGNSVSSQLKELPKIQRCLAEKLIGEVLFYAKLEILTFETSINVKKKFRTIFWSAVDASGTGWGAFSNGKAARGFWTKDDLDNHINYLELLAAYLGLKCFAKNISSCQILLRIDNTTAIAYINKMGGDKHAKLTLLSRKIWQWCEARGIWLFASYIKSKENTDADLESRVLNVDVEWELSQAVFNKICNVLGKPDIDIFATRANKKCVRYISWHRDPNAENIDAFTVDWSTYNMFYAFPPFSLIPKMIQKIQSDQATVSLVDKIGWTQYLRLLVRRFNRRYNITVKTVSTSIFDKYKNSTGPWRSRQHAFNARQARVM
ncbi:hypothetical protein ACJJTC_019074 [Scirpophaga incertulas]